jgi:cytochrome c553
MAKAEPCLACHGANGVSENEGIPSLAGQPDYYIQWQLVFFRLGSAKSEIMEPIAAELSDEDIRDLGTYLASLPPPPAPAQPDDDPALTAAGAKLVVQAHCNSCHGEKLTGQQAAARLAHQREEVLLKALHDYKTGARRGTGGAAMPEVVSPLVEDDLKALAHFLARVP